MKGYKYYIEVPILDGPAEDGPRWLDWDTLTTMGDSFDECVANASVSTIDQDGGCGPEKELDSLPLNLYDYCLAEIERKCV